MRDTPFIPGETNDQELLNCFYGQDWKLLREQQLKSRWNYDFSSIDAYQQSVSDNRRRLKEYLGRWSQMPTIMISEERQLSIAEADLYNLKVDHIVLKAGIVNLTFNAYIVHPSAQNDLNKIGVVAIHGHYSSAEKLVGLGKEDYGRRLAIHLAQKGFTVIVPNVTSAPEINEAISANAFIYGYTLHGLMTQFVLSSAEYLRTHCQVGQVGVYGISNGGFLALISAAVDPRLSFVVVSGMLSPIYERFLRNPNAEPLRYYNYFQGPFWMEFDIRQLASLIVPRILIFEVGESDKIVKNWWKQEYDALLDIYKKLKIESRLGVVLYKGWHEIPENHGADALIAKIQNHPELFSQYEP